MTKGRDGKNYKLTPKQEKFALVFVESGNASKAYRDVYNVAMETKDATVWRKAKELVDNGKVAARVKELQEAAQGRHEITIDQLTDMYKTTFDLAARSKQPAAMNGSLAGLAKLHGLNQEKRVIEGSHKVQVQVITGVPRNPIDV